MILKQFMLQNLIRSSLLFILFFREEATTYIILCHTFYGRRYCSTIAKLLLDIFQVPIAFRVTYTHLAIWTNAPLITARFGDTIFYMDVTHLEGKQERSYFHTVINA